MTFSDSKSQTVTQLNPAVKSRFFIGYQQGLIQFMLNSKNRHSSTFSIHTLE